jgi:ribosomal-protein-alanine N-acetyltransferase
MCPSQNEAIHFPVFDTERLTLRLLSMQDLDFVFQHFSDPNVSEFLMDAPPVASMEEAKGIIRAFEHPEEKNRVRWVLERKEDRQVIGTIGFHNWEKNYFHAEIGYDLSAPCWGQGYMSEALPPVLRFGFEQMQLHRIHGFIYPGNLRSIALMEKFGFTLEGILRDFFYCNGKYYDHALYSLLFSEWQENQ